MKNLFVLLSMLFMMSCNSFEQKTTPHSLGYTVEYAGALKNMMHKGDISAKADLSAFNDRQHFYALGAIENLKGEIQIFNSKPFNSIVRGDTLYFDRSYELKATLVVYASVEKWQSIVIPDNISSYEELESFITQTSLDYGLNNKAPFPFLIEGTIASADWHVIDWPAGDTVHTHQKHKSSGLNGTVNNRPVQLLGFYSNAHHTIFTHHSTNMHIHIKTEDNEIAGHLDGLILGKGMILKLPELAK